MISNLHISLDINHPNFKVWISLKQKIHIIHVICLKNIISVLHVSLDIKHIKLRFGFL